MKNFNDIINEAKDRLSKDFEVVWTIQPILFRHKITLNLLLVSQTIWA